MEIFERDFLIDLKDVDRYLDIKIDSFIEKLNTIAIEDNIRLNLGPDLMADRGLIWILYQWDVHILKHDVYMENITFKTYVEDKKGIYLYRYFLAENKKGEIVGYALSVWILINEDKRKITRIPEDVIETYNLIEKNYSDNEKLAISKTNPKSVKRNKDINFDKDKKIEVLFSDIDFNGHVNNVKYIKWAMEGLETTDDELLLKENNIKRITIVYKKEKLPLGKIEVKSKIDDNKVYQEILNDENEILTLSKIELIPR